MGDREKDIDTTSKSSPLESSSPNTIGIINNNESPSIIQEASNECLEKEKETEDSLAKMMTDILLERGIKKAPKSWIPICERNLSWINDKAKKSEKKPSIKDPWTRRDESSKFMELRVITLGARFMVRVRGEDKLQQL